MTQVGTVNPGLTLALVLLFLALVVAIVVLGGLLASARKQIHAASREVARVAGRHKAAKARAEEAEEQAARLMHAVETAIATARQAVENRGQLEAVGQRLGELFAYVTEPLEELAPGGPDWAAPGRKLPLTPSASPS
jgi:Na+-transporting methylmalonyl-CoA/oxaloacetate decarboxylase gamma subunit